MVAAVAGTATDDAAFRLVLAERLIKGGEHVRRRGESPLGINLQAAPLVFQIQAERVGVAACCR